MKLLTNVGLALLLALAVAALGTAAVWRWRPDLVHTVDSAWMYRFSSRPTAEALRLTELARTDPAAALPGFAQLVDELRTDLKADRRFPARRIALRGYAEALLQVGRTEEGLAQARTLVALDDRDIPMRLWFARTLAASQEHKAEGLDTLRALQRELSALGVVTRALYETLVASHQGAEALEAVAAHLESAARPALSLEGIEAPWHVAWSVDGRFTAEQQAQVTPATTDRYLAVPFELPREARYVRFDAPARSHLAGGLPALSLATKSGPRALELPLDALRRNEVELDAQGFATTGGVDPWFSFALPDVPAAELLDGPLTGRLVVELGRAPRWIEAAALRPEADAVQRDLAGAKRWRALERLRAARLAGLASAQVEASVGGTALGTADLGRVADNEVAVELEVLGQGAGATLSLRLPDLPGVGIALQQVAVLVDGAWLDLAVGQAEPTGLRAVAPGAWIIEASPAGLAWPLPAGATEVSGVRVKGRSR